MSCEEEDQYLTLKTGSSAVFAMQYTEGDGTDPSDGIDISEYQIAMDFINPKTGMALSETSLDNGITLIDATNGYYEVDAGDTSDWPLGDIPVDIKYTFQGKSVHTETFYITMIQGLSQ